MTLRVELVGDGKQRVWKVRHGHGIEYTTDTGIENLTNRNGPTPKLEKINPLTSDVVEIVFRTPIPAGVRIELTLGTDE